MRILRLFLALGGLLATTSLANALVRIDIDLSTQTMRVVSGLGETYEWPISSGRPGHLTPTGWYRPVGLYPMVHSAKYGNAPMPHSIFFRSQYAIHGTLAAGSLGHPASHGCVRLAQGDAATLYAMVKAEGASIRISGTTPGSGSLLASRERRRASSALGYAPWRRTRTLKEWARDPLGGW